MCIKKSCLKWFVAWLEANVVISLKDMGPFGSFCDNMCQGSYVYLSDNNRVSCFCPVYYEETTTNQGIRDDDFNGLCSQTINILIVNIIS